MKNWYYFWITWLVLAGTAFAVLALIVMVGGLLDLRQMFARLTHQHHPSEPPPPQG